MSRVSGSGRWHDMLLRLGLRGDTRRMTLRIIYTILIGGSLATIVSFARIGDARTWWIVAGVSVVSGIAGEAFLHHASDATTALLSGSAGVERRPDPPLSKAKYLMEREEFDDALVELDQVWAKFPGRHEVLACYERVLVDRMAAPSAFAEFLESALPKMEAVDKPYAYLRLAELHADRIGNREVGFLWTSRLLSEFPGSKHVAAARALRDSLKPKESPAG